MDDSGSRNRINTGSCIRVCWVYHASERVEPDSPWKPVQERLRVETLENGTGSGQSAEEDESQGDSSRGGNQNLDQIDRYADFQKPGRGTSAW